MHNATTHATGAPAPAGKGLSPTSRSTRCILSSDLLLNAAGTIPQGYSPGLFHRNTRQPFRSIPPVRTSP